MQLLSLSVYEGEMQHFAQVIHSHWKQKKRTRSIMRLYTVIRQPQAENIHRNANNNVKNEEGSQLNIILILSQRPSVSAIELLPIIIILIGTRFFLHRSGPARRGHMVLGARGFQEGGRDVCRREVAVVRMAKQLSLNSNEVLEVN